MSGKNIKESDIEQESNLCYNCKGPVDYNGVCHKCAAGSLSSALAHDGVDFTESGHTITIEEEVKDDNGKLRYDLIPPQPLEELAKIYTKGLEKYGDFDWHKHGVHYSRHYAALFRHLQKWWKGEDNDSDSHTHHLASVAFYCFAIMQFTKEGREGLDDRRWTSKDTS